MERSGQIDTQVCLHSRPISAVGIIWRQVNAPTTSTYSITGLKNADKRMYLYYGTL